MQPIVLQTEEKTACRALLFLELSSGGREAYKSQRLEALTTSLQAVIEHLDRALGGTLTKSDGEMSVHVLANVRVIKLEHEEKDEN